MTVEPEVEGTLLGRAAQIGRVMARHGLTGRGDSTRDRARGFREALEELGPTFAKLGQILSTRPDLLPSEFVEELRSLQDQVPPMSEAEVVAVMEEELGVPWEDVFESVDPRPLAAGTIGQVHRARLETGEDVVVKVQRPTAREEILRDLGLMSLFAEKTQSRPVFRQIVDVPAVIAHLSDSLQRELDYTQEAANAERLREVLAPFSRLRVPEVHEAYTSRRLLVLERIDGVPVTQAPMGEARSEAARQLVESYFRQILAEGFFHADPHPGNMLWANDSVYFLDLGMVGEVPPQTRELVLLLLMAFWQEDAGFLTEVVLQLGGDEQRPDVDLAGLREDLAALLGTYRHASLQELELGPILQSITETATRHGVRLPASLALTGKALAQMQTAATVLDPTLDPFAAVGSFVLRDLLLRLRGSADPKRLFYEGQKLRVRATRLVAAFERVTGARPGPKLQVQIRGTELENVISSGARRLSVGLTGAAAILGSAITASAETVDAWVPLAFGACGAFLTGMLVVDILRRHQR
jgi:predicted unusual protein kinase regulating ubiquinone biosynthesis (AarF/ABC1/UbiB family)